MDVNLAGPLWASAVDAEDDVNRSAIWNRSGLDTAGMVDDTETLSDLDHVIGSWIKTEPCLSVVEDSHATHGDNLEILKLEDPVLDATTSTADPFSLSYIVDTSVSSSWFTGLPPQPSLPVSELGFSVDPLSEDTDILFKDDSHSTEDLRFLDPASPSASDGPDDQVDLTKLLDDLEEICHVAPSVPSTVQDSIACLLSICGDNSGDIGQSCSRMNTCNRSGSFETEGVKEGQHNNSAAENQCVTDFVETENKDELFSDKGVEQKRRSALCEALAQAAHRAATNKALQRNKSAVGDAVLKAAKALENFAAAHGGEKDLECDAASAAARTVRQALREKFSKLDRFARQQTGNPPLQDRLLLSVEERTRQLQRAVASAKGRKISELPVKSSSSGAPQESLKDRIKACLVPGPSVDSSVGQNIPKGPRGHSMVAHPKPTARCGYGTPGTLGNSLGVKVGRSAVPPQNQAFGLNCGVPRMYSVGATSVPISRIGSALQESREGRKSKVRERVVEPEKKLVVSAGEAKDASTAARCLPQECSVLSSPVPLLSLPGEGSVSLKRKGSDCLDARRLSRFRVQ